MYFKHISSFCVIFPLFSTHLSFFSCERNFHFAVLHIIVSLCCVYELYGTWRILLEMKKKRGKVNKWNTARLLLHPFYHSILRSDDTLKSQFSKSVFCYLEKSSPISNNDICQKRLAPSPIPETSNGVVQCNERLIWIESACRSAISLCVFANVHSLYSGILTAKRLYWGLLGSWTSTTRFIFDSSSCSRCTLGNFTL